jgi:hypothetical protein
MLFLERLETHSIAGLPVLAIFGIMILFGALALVSTLFARLDLSCRDEALALPPGSIRAAIALSLIVLFALVSVMLYQSLSRPYPVEHLSYAQKEALVREPGNRVLGVLPEKCRTDTAVPATTPASAGGASGVASAPAPASPASAAGRVDCPASDLLYTVHLRQSPGSEATDLAKQLLILIGTLMTSVVSFYFASRSTEAVVKSMASRLAPDPQEKSQSPRRPTSDAAANGAGTTGTVTTGQATATDGLSDDHADGCDVPIENPTSDIDLPAAKGGVSP